MMTYRERLLVKTIERTVQQETEGDASTERGLGGITVLYWATGNGVSLWKKDNHFFSFY